MTVASTIDPAGWLGEYLDASDADTDLRRAMPATFAEVLMSAQASLQCAAALGERCEERTDSRNGYRHRPWDTRLGSIALAVPELRAGVCSPELLLRLPRRAEQALVAVVCQAYVEGVPMRRVDDLVKAIGIEGISRSEVSRMAAELDAEVAEFRTRPLGAGPYKYLWTDGVTHKVREGGREVNVTAVIATAANAEGRREIVGFDIVTTEDTAAWTEFLRGLLARGLSGVELVISDAHGGIKPRSPRCSPTPPGSAAGPTSWPTRPRGSRRPPGGWWPRPSARSSSSPTPRPPGRNSARSSNA